jgi:hypothetical protein
MINQESSEDWSYLIAIAATGGRVLFLTVLEAKHP